jgi:hypothetical protein
MKHQNYQIWAETLCLATIQMETPDAVIDKHFGLYEGMLVEDGALIDRLVGRDMSGTERVNNKMIASAFTLGREEAMDIVRAVLADSYTERQVLRWSDDYSDGEDLVLEFPLDESIGKAFIKASWHDWNSGAAECHGLRIVLSKDEDSAKYHPERNFFVKTLYPYPEEEDMAEVQARSQKAWMAKQAGRKWA